MNRVMCAWAALGVICAGATITPSPAVAGAAKDYVDGLVGSWRGSGTLRDDKGKAVRINCRSTNQLRTGRRYLSMRGRCAASSGARSLVGRIRYSADGTRLAGASLTLAGRGGAMATSLSGNTLTLSGSQAIDQKVYKTRAIVQGGGRSYSITVYARIDGKWENRGSLRFRR